LAPESLHIGRVKEGNKKLWVRWPNMCRPKSNGDLGIRDLRMVNQAIICK